MEISDCKPRPSTYDVPDPMGTQRSEINLIDVARQANVSPATVSRVINRGKGVATDTARRVVEVIEQLGYQSPRLRRQARQRQQSWRRAKRFKQTLNIGLLLPYATRDYAYTTLDLQLIEGAQAAADSQSGSLLVTRLQPDGSLPACITDRHVRGLIIKHHEIQPPISRQLRELPCVWVKQLGHETPDFGDWVLPHQSRVGTLACDHLHQLGHQRLILLHPNFIRASGEMDPTTLFTNHGGLDRINAFERRAQELGLHCSRLTQNGLDYPDFAALILRHAGTDRTGLFLPIGYHYIVNLLHALRARNAPLFQTMDLIFASNHPPEARTLDPRLPCIDVGAAEIARVAVERLIRRIEQPARPRQTILIEPLTIPAES